MNDDYMTYLSDPYNYRNEVNVICKEGHSVEQIKTDRFFPSSKKCSVCGAVKKELALSERKYCCECGNVMDRDVNAAVNIREEGIRILRAA